MSQKQTPSYAPGLTQNHIRVNVDAAQLARLAAALDNTVDKARLSFTEDAIRVEAVAKHNTSATSVTVDDVTWATSVCETDVGLSTSELRSAVESRVDDDRVDVTVTSDPDEPGCEIVVSSESTLNWVEAVNPNEVRAGATFADLIDYDYETRATAPAYKFKGAIGAVSEAASKNVRVTAMDDGLLLEGDLKFAPENFTGRSWMLDAANVSVDGPDAEQVFSPGLLTEVTNALPFDGSVTLHMTEGVPIHVEHEDGIEIVVAPRVLPEDDDE